MISEIIKFKYKNGGYKSIPYHFKDEAERDNFYDEANSDHSYRKIIGIIKTKCE